MDAAQFDFYRCLVRLARTLRRFRMTANYRPTNEHAQEKSVHVVSFRVDTIQIPGNIPLLTDATSSTIANCDARKRVQDLHDQRQQ